MAPEFQLFTTLRYDPLLIPLASNTEAWDRDLPSGSPFYMLPYHRDRMLQAAEHFGWNVAASRIRGPVGLTYLLEELSKVIDTKSAEPLRVKALLDPDGNVKVESTPLQVLLSPHTLFPARLPPPPPRSESEVGPNRLTGGPLKSRDVQGYPEMDEPWVVVLDPGRTNPSPQTTYKTTSRDMYTEARDRADIKTFNEKKEVLLVSNRDQEIMEGSLTSVYFWRDGRWTTPPVSSGGQRGTTRRWALEKGLCVEGAIKADSLIDGEECWISNGARGFIWGCVKLSWWK
jgi:4-amino-4-deoxychorismate lyase